MWSTTESLQEGAGGPRAGRECPWHPGWHRGAGRGTETPGQTPQLAGSHWQCQSGFPALLGSAFGWGRIRFERCENGISPPGEPKSDPQSLRGAKNSSWGEANQPSRARGAALSVLGPLPAPRVPAGKGQAEPLALHRGGIGVRGEQRGGRAARGWLGRQEPSQGWRLQRSGNRDNAVFLILRSPWPQRGHAWSSKADYGSSSCFVFCRPVTLTPCSQLADAPGSKNADFCGFNP